MAELILVRHAQASFGSADAGGYDRLSDLGRQQSELVGRCLHEAGWQPDRLVCGTLSRQRDTLDLMGFDGDVEVHAGLNEYDFHDLLQVRFEGDVPAEVMGDRKTHFRTLRDTVRDWQQGGLEGAAESWAAYTARVAAARTHATRPGAQKVLAVSSGGTIARTVADAISAPDEMMITLNLQMKNTSITRFVFTDRGAFYLNEFNATPHLMPAERADFLTYS